MARYVPSKNLVLAAENRQGAQFRPSNQLRMEPSEAENPALHASSNFRPFLDEVQGPNRWGDMGLSARVDASGNRNIRKLGTPPQRLNRPPIDNLTPAPPQALTVPMYPAGTPQMERADVSGLGSFWSGVRHAVQAPLHVVAKIAAPAHFTGQVRRLTLRRHTSSGAQGDGTVDVNGNPYPPGTYAWGSWNVQHGFPAGIAAPRPGGYDTRSGTAGLGAFWGNFTTGITSGLKAAVQAPLHAIAHVAAPPLHFTQRLASPVMNVRQAGGMWVNVRDLAQNRMGWQHPSGTPVQQGASTAQERTAPSPAVDSPFNPYAPGTIAASRWNAAHGMPEAAPNNLPGTMRPLTTPILRADVSGLGAVSATNPFVLGALGLGAVGILAYVLLRKKG